MKNQKDDENYRARLKFAKKAYDSGCLIFSSETQKHYSPREFLESDEVVIIKTWEGREVNNMNLVYPEAAIGRQLEDLNKAQKKFDAFMRKVLTAFDFKPTSVKRDRRTR